MLGSAAFRASVVPGGALAGPWVSNELWRRARAVPSLDLRFAESKSLTDAASGQSLVTFTRASSGTYVGSDGLLKTATTNEPRFDHNPTTGESLGLLVEDQRTNSIRNNTMVGAVAGTPGTLPTNWAATTPANGITREILGTGTEDGIAYIDFRFSGTNTLGSNYYMDISLDSGTIAAAQGQTWTQSVYVGLLAGVITGAAFSVPVNMVLYGTPGFSDNASGALASATNARLAQQRFSVAKTFANVGTTGASPRIGWTIVTGGTIDFTLRIGLPQLEQGAFATSVIPTSTAAATRSADVASITGANFSSWYRQDEGTVFADVNSAPVNNIAQLTFDISEGAGNERMFQRRNASGIAAVAVLDNGVTQGDIGNVVISASARYRSGFAYKLNDLELVVNGSGSATDTSATLPTPDRIHIGQNFASGQSCNGTVRRLTFWPSRLAGSTLSAITQ